MQAQIRRVKNSKRNAEMFYEAREKVIKFHDHYFTMVFNVRYKATHREVLEILVLRQIFPKLPITLTQVKAANTSENVLNELRQIRYSLYRAKVLVKY